MELYIIMGLLALVLVLEIVLLLTRGRSSGQEETFRRMLDEHQRQIEETIRRSEANTEARIHEVSGLVTRQEAELLKRLGEHQSKLYETLTEQTDRLNRRLQESVGQLQESNEKKLDEMRATVDEKLSTTLTQRLDSSFKTVGEQLQSVYQSLGEMKTLAGDVNSLQRVLSNVKARGTWAEVQLGNLLEQTLTAEQFERNVSVRKNKEAVEYAIKIPSKEDDDHFVLLPIDSKFPQEDYLRLCDAAEKGNKEAAEAAAKALATTIKHEAEKISTLYINVPVTTDFAILFLPTEGLYAEVLRSPGLAEEVQRRFHIMICGPTTLTAFLNTLSMGFRTIALDKRAAEVWKVLGAAKMQYEKFGSLLDRVHKKITEAGDTIEEAQKRNGLIQKKLRKVELPDASEQEAAQWLGLDERSTWMPADEDESEPAAEEGEED